MSINSIMMKFIQPISVCLVLLIAASLTAFSRPSNGEELQRRVRETPADSTITDTTLGISFRTMGLAVERKTGGYRIPLARVAGTLMSPAAQMMMSSRRGVDLPGSFGGTLYPDDPKVSSFLKNRMKIDSVTIGGLVFRREYWGVYAGMGAWESVINCSAFMNGRWYTVSLNADVMLGRPGEIINGKAVDAGDLRNHLLNVLIDPGEPAVRDFNVILSTIQMHPNAR